MVLFTAALAIVTFWLAFETHELRKDSVRSITAAEESAGAALASVNIARQQFDASVQPILTLEFRPGAYGTHTEPDGRQWYDKDGVLHVKNEGKIAFKITNIYVVVQRPNIESYEVELTSYRQRVITPAFPFNDRISFGVRSKEDLNAVIGLNVICSDMAGISINTYSWHPEHGLRHRIGPLPPESALAT